MEYVVRLLTLLDNIDRRLIYLVVAVSLSAPIIFGVTLRPAEMSTAQAFYNEMELLEKQEKPFVVIAMDWGPGTMAENRPQSMLAVEHLMRKRIPFALISIYSLASPFLEELPRQVADRLEEEFPGESWEYGQDWVNWGYRPGGILMIQGLAKAKNIHEVLLVDAASTPISEIPVMANVKSIKDISMLIEVTGLVGAFNNWVQFFQGPVFLHGCTSITIPEAFIYYSSKQIRGFFEGLAGAAYYETLLIEKYPNRKKETVALSTNSGLSFAQIVVLLFILLGNVGIAARKMLGSHLEEQQ